jgi:hypothetical protein
MTKSNPHRERRPHAWASPVSDRPYSWSTLKHGTWHLTRQVGTMTRDYQVRERVLTIRIRIFRQHGRQDVVAQKWDEALGSKDFEVDSVSQPCLIHSPLARKRHTCAAAVNNIRNSILDQKVARGAIHFRVLGQSCYTAQRDLCSRAPDIDFQRKLMKLCSQHFNCIRRGPL